MSNIGRMMLARKKFSMRVDSPSRKGVAEVDTGESHTDRFEEMKPIEGLAKDRLEWRNRET